MNATRKENVMKNILKIRSQDRSGRLRWTNRNAKAIAVMPLVRIPMKRIGSLMLGAEFEAREKSMPVTERGGSRRLRPWKEVVAIYGRKEAQILGLVLAYARQSFESTLGTQRVLAMWLLLLLQPPSSSSYLRPPPLRFLVHPWWGTNSLLMRYELRKYDALYISVHLYRSFACPSRGFKDSVSWNGESPLSS